MAVVEIKVSGWINASYYSVGMGGGRVMYGQPYKETYQIWAGDIARDPASLHYYLFAPDHMWVGPFPDHDSAAAAWTLLT